jgi:hypothetical protein
MKYQRFILIFILFFVTGLGSLVLANHFFWSLSAALVLSVVFARAVLFLDQKHVSESSESIEASLQRALASARGVSNSVEGFSIRANQQSFDVQQTGLMADETQALVDKNVRGAQASLLLVAETQNELFFLE